MLYLCFIYALSMLYLCPIHALSMSLRDERDMRDERDERDSLCTTYPSSITNQFPIHAPIHAPPCPVHAPRPCPVYAPLRLGYKAIQKKCYLISEEFGING